jgi:hypothetical protein
MQWKDYSDECCPKNGTCTNEECREYPSCRRCRRTVEANPWMLNSIRAQGDNNRPFGV